MRLKDHSNEKLETKRKGYNMRNLFVIVMAVLLTIAIALPAQAEQAQDVTGQTQPLEDHTWGGDPDDENEYGGWVHWWWYVMNVLFFYDCDAI